MGKFKTVLAILLVVALGVCAMASGESETEDQGASGAASATEKANLGDYNVVIESCRLAEDYEGKPVVIVKYNYTNVSDDDATTFSLAVNDEVYQNGVGLNKAYVLSDDAGYSSDNQSKAIKKGSSLEVEVAYELNDTTTELVVEVQELFSFDDNTITKKFSISG